MTEMMIVKSIVVMVIMPMILMFGYDASSSLGWKG